jgi:hypothetical protein
VGAGAPPGSGGAEGAAAAAVGAGGAGGGEGGGGPRGAGGAGGAERSGAGATGGAGGICGGVETSFNDTSVAEGGVVDPFDPGRVDTGKTELTWGWMIGDAGVCGGRGMPGVGKVNARHCDGEVRG